MRQPRLEAVVYVCRGPVRPGLAASGPKGLSRWQLFPEYRAIGAIAFSPRGPDASAGAAPKLVEPLAQSVVINEKCPLCFPHKVLFADLVRLK